MAVSFGLFAAHNVTYCYNTDLLCLGVRFRCTKQKIKAKGLNQWLDDFKIKSKR